MTLIKQFVQAMVNQDSVALSKCFSPTAIFVDYCPKDAGQPQLHAYGPEGIDMFFRNRFLFKKFPGLLLRRLQRLSHPRRGHHPGFQRGRRDPAPGGPPRLTPLAPCTLPDQT